jgi:hypothetical protein
VGISIRIAGWRSSRRRADIDTSIVHVRQYAAWAARSEKQSMGRWWQGLTGKIHVAADTVSSSHDKRAALRSERDGGSSPWERII